MTPTEKLAVANDVCDHLAKALDLLCDLSPWYHAHPSEAIGKLEKQLLKTIDTAETLQKEYLDQLHTAYLQQLQK